MQPLPSAFISAVKQQFPATLWSCDAADCFPYGYDNSREHSMPQMVFFATQTDAVQNLVQLCRQYHVPIVARGRGTGTAGGCIPVHHGVVVSFERWQTPLHCDPANRLLIAAPGVTNQAAQECAKQQGFFWPPDPSSSAFCTLGGNLAYNSAGPRAVKYGTPRENTLSLSVVLGTGEHIKTGTCTTKGVVGYDLTRLFIGSEGTLGLITEATLKLTPLPEKTVTLRALYSSIDAATDAVVRIMAQPAIPSALEFMDEHALILLKTHAAIDFPEQTRALLLINVDGFAKTLPTETAAIQNAAQGTGCLDCTLAENEEEAKTLWQARKALSPTLRSIAAKKINEDVVVPISKLPQLIASTQKLAKRFDFPIVNFGHAGNGNIHVNLLVDPELPEQADAAQHALDALFDTVLQLNGTLSGEHGVGIAKKSYVGRELSTPAIALMQNIKQQCDPDGILNPGKMF